MPLSSSLVAQSVTAAFNTHLFTSETAEQIKFFMTGGDFRDFITFISHLKNCFIELCFRIINSITGLMHFNVCRIFVVIPHRHLGK